MKKTILFSFSALLLGATACAGDPPTTLLDRPQREPGDTVGDSIDKPGSKPEDAVAEGNTFDHMPSLGLDDTRDPLDIAAQREEEGSPEVRSRLHSCQKLQIVAIRNILTDFGVNLDATGEPDTAGELLAGGGTALGQANYAARMGEDLVWTAAGAAKQFDIFVQAAPEIIAAMPTLPQCQVEGAGVEMFDVSGDGTDVSCNEDAVSCLIGRPATADHLAICKSLIESASTLENGQNIAVATLLAAAHSCE